MRLHARTAVIENGVVQLPDEAPWLAAAISELTAFPAVRATIRSTRPDEALAGAGSARRRTRGIDYRRRLDDQGLLRLERKRHRSAPGHCLRPDFVIRCVLRGETSAARNQKGVKTAAPPARAV